MLQSTADTKKMAELRSEGHVEGINGNDVGGGQEKPGVGTEAVNTNARHENVEPGNTDSVEGTSQQAEQAQVTESISGGVNGVSTTEVPVDSLINQISEAINSDGDPTALADAANLPKFGDQG